MTKTTGRDGTAGSGGLAAAWALALLLALAAAIRFAAVLSIGDVTTLRGDENYYVRAAHALAAGAGQPGSSHPRRSPSTCRWSSGPSEAT